MSQRCADDETDGYRFVQHAVEHSKIWGTASCGASMGARAMARVAAVTRESFLYRWLTAEPEPDVVVIDLRETYTVGPVIRLLDAGVEWLAPYLEASALKRLADVGVASLERFAETRTGRALAAVLAPPEPPANDADRPDESDADRPGAGDDGDESTDDGP